MALIFVMFDLFTSKCMLLILSPTIRSECKKKTTEMKTYWMLTIIKKTRKKLSCNFEIAAINLLKHGKLNCCVTVVDVVGFLGINSSNGACSEIRQ